MSLDPKCYVCRRLPPASTKREGMSGWCSWCRRKWVEHNKRWGYTPEEFWSHQNDPCTECENAPRGHIRKKTPKSQWEWCHDCRMVETRSRYWRKHKKKINAKKRAVRRSRLTQSSQRTTQCFPTLVHDGAS